MIFNRSVIFILAVSLGLATISSCKKEDGSTPVPDTATELSGDLTSRTLEANKKYLLKGYVFVRSGQTLTIPAGTIIFGDKASKGTLVIDKGGKIIADGTPEKPIVFTSERDMGERDKGDWGGIIILGNANVNQASTSIEGVNPSVSFGTSNSTANDAENSGILRNVRIEFAGIALSPNNEINGITFGGVGNGTIVENVQVSYSGDDAFEWFGGTVNCKRLVSLGAWDDDFDTDFGYTGKIQYAISIRDPFSADQSGSNAFESDNDAAGSANAPITSPVFSNVSVFGPRFDTIASISGSYQNAAHIRRNSQMSLFNSVITGFPVGIRIDGQSTYNRFANGSGEIKNNLLISLGTRTSSPVPFAGSSGNIPVSDTIRNYFTSFNPAGFITRTPQLNYSALGINEGLFLGKTPTLSSNPNLSVGGGVISSGANFTHSKLQGFFDVVGFHGAFGSTDWTDGWANFDPKNTTY
jgi:hypothetical protein